MNITTAKVEGCNSEGQLDRRLMPMNYPAFSWLVPVMDHRGLCSASLYLPRSKGFGRFLYLMSFSFCKASKGKLQKRCSWRTGQVRELSRM